MRLNWSRRTFLTGLSAVSLGGLAGCTAGLGSSRGATDVILHNEADKRRTVDVTVSQRNGGSSSIDARLELGPNSRRKINNKVLMGSDYDVEVTVSDSETDTPPYTETQQWDDAGKSLHVIVHDQIEFAIEIG